VFAKPKGRLPINMLSNAIEWPMDTGTWERFACRVAGHGFTRAEWHDVLPNRTHRPVCPA
jgi:hypothetical protein